MDYELAKELKDAGFPQGQVINRTVCAHNKEFEKSTIHVMDCKETAYDPTLEELIEECGSKFGDLTLIDTGTGNCWFANSYGLLSPKASSTPTEAVARLWLALKKKV